MRWLSGSPVGYQGWKIPVSNWTIQYFSYMKKYKQEYINEPKKTHFCLHNTECPVDQAILTDNEVGTYLEESANAFHQGTKSSPKCVAIILTTNMEEFHWKKVPCNRLFHTSVVCTKRLHRDEGISKGNTLLGLGVDKSIRFTSGALKMPYSSSAGYACSYEMMVNRTCFTMVASQYPTSHSWNIICKQHTSILMFESIDKYTFHTLIQQYKVWCTKIKKMYLYNEDNNLCSNFDLLRVVTDKDSYKSKLMSEGQNLIPCSTQAMPLICPLNTYQCQDFTCILYLHVCDGKAECMNGEDELCPEL